MIYTKIREKLFDGVKIINKFIVTLPKINLAL